MRFKRETLHLLRKGYREGSYKNKELSLFNLAVYINMEVSNLQKIEQGKIKNPSGGSVKKIANFFNVPMEIFYE